jgi:hypothetical protein
VVVMAMGVADLVVHHAAIMAQFARIVAHFVARHAGGAVVAVGAGNGQALAIVANFGAILANVMAGGGNSGGVHRLGVGHGRRHDGGENGSGDNGEDELAHGVTP